MAEVPRRSVWEAQRRALELYPDSDYLDCALVQLDRAVCLVQDGEVPEGASMAARVLQDLPAEQRDGIILGRARDAARHIRPGNQAHPAVRDLHELLAPMTA